MEFFYQIILLAGVVLFFINVKNKIVNNREKGKVLYKFEADNRLMNFVSAIVLSMLILMGVSLYGASKAGTEINQPELFQYIATVVLFLAVGMNSFGSTVIAEGGIVKNNNLIKWQDIRRTEWTGFTDKKCKLMLDFASKKGIRTMKITVKEDRKEKDKVVALLKQYKKSSKNKK